MSLLDLQIQMALCSHIQGGYPKSSSTADDLSAVISLQAAEQQLKLARWQARLT